MNLLNTKIRSQGFTLIEMMVVVSIVAIMMTVVFFNSSDFTNTVGLNNQAYLVALALREAQTYGLSVVAYQKEVAPNQYQPQYQVGYGVHFETGANSYFSFVDANEDHSYTPGESISETYNLDRGNVIYKICRTKGGGADCSEKAGADISFKRPDPEAFLEFINPGGIVLSGNQVDSIIIVLKTPQGRKKQIEIYSTGQISVAEVTASQAQ